MCVVWYICFLYVRVVRLEVFVKEVLFFILFVFLKLYVDIFNMICFEILIKGIFNGKFLFSIV